MDCPCWIVMVIVALLPSALDDKPAGTFDWQGATVLGPGVRYARVSWGTNQIDVVRIDAQTNGLRFYTTERCPGYVAGLYETQTRKTTEFVADSQNTGHKVLVAINVNEFTPVEVGRVNLQGYAAWEGTSISADGGPAFVVGKDGAPRIARLAAGADPSPMQAAVSGQQDVLKKGILAKGIKPNRRTGIGISQDGRYAYFITLSHAGIAEVAEWLQHFGAFDGILMDGGRSTGMARWDGRSSLAVSGSLQRAVGNSIGVYYNTHPAELVHDPATLDPACAQGHDAAGQRFEVWNAGGSTLSYSITADAGWLSIHPASGNSIAERDTIQVVYHTAALDAGSYHAMITLTAPGVSRSPQMIPVTLSVSR